MTETRSTCPYCGVGCGVIIESDGTQITGVRGDPDHPANFGRLCTKGSTLHLTASAPVTLATRLLQPLQRLQRDGAPTAIEWDAAVELAATRIADTVRTHGPDAVGLYLSGQLLTEDYYVFNKLAKGLLGTNNVDTNSRLCMSSAVAGYKRTLGADAPPCSYEDLDHADTVLITGSNMAWAHPILFRRLEDARKARPAERPQRWIVVDVRRTETAEQADLFLQIQPGTDVALCHGLLHVMLWEGWTDAAYIAAHTRGFEALRDEVRAWTPKETARVCGIAEADLITAARWLAQADRSGGRTLSLYCQGLNQSAAGTDKNAALINLHLATGQIGQAGAGPFSLTGQPNAMGGREVGGLANLLSAHRDLGNPEHRAEVAALWGLDKIGRDVPATPGKSAIEMFQAAADGEIKLLWIVCTNPAQSLPDQALVRRALERCEFVIVQEAFATTATAAHADLLLPASTWGEKTGTVTNSERRISRVRPAVTAPGSSRADWQIGVDIARRVEALLPERLNGQATLFPYADAESVWLEHRESTRGRDLDITGLSWAMLDGTGAGLGPQQWPLREGEAGGKARLYEDGVFPTADGRAAFSTMAFRGVAEPRDARYPFALTTGRLRDQWHGMSRTGTLGRLFGHVSEPAVELNPIDLARRGLTDGELVEVRSRRGSVVLPVQASTAVAPTQASIPMHWGAEVLGGVDAKGVARLGVNGLTLPTYCPTSKQPELKHSAVRIEPAALPWRMLGLAWLPQEQVLAVREQLKPLMGEFGYALALPFGREPHAQGLSGILWRAAAAAPVAEDLVQQIEALLGLAGTDTMRYHDRQRGQYRAVRQERSTGSGEAVVQTLRGVLLGGDTRAEAWIKTLLQDELPSQAYGRALLAGSATPPVAVAARSPQVCTCFDVSAAQIGGVLARCSGSIDQRLAQLQGELKCGTNCGSCLPALRSMVRDTPVSAGVGA